LVARETKFAPAKVEEHEDFKFLNYGSLAYVGSSQGVADLKMRIWNEVSLFSLMKHPVNIQGHPSLEERSGQQSGGGRPEGVYLERGQLLILIQGTFSEHSVNIQ
jgi:hypothetical protein